MEFEAPDYGPYGLPFYFALGFVPVDTQQEIGGIRFTPMKYTITP